MLDMALTIRFTTYLDAHTRQRSLMHASPTVDGLSARPLLCELCNLLPFTFTYFDVIVIEIHFSFTAIRYALCKSIYNYLDRDMKNVCVVHCIDGKASSAVVTVALFLYTRLFPTIDEGLQMFAVKRCPPGLNASQYRYLNYYKGLLAEPPVWPHHKPVTLTSLTISPVPLFTKNRDGCRPYVEVFQGEQRLLSSLTDYERMTVYRSSDEKVRIKNLSIYQLLYNSNINEIIISRSQCQ